ncbi:MAG: hypothetical protein N2691_05860 [Patescibacteria group bacterium]|nr:hypothetical protein [Patescibacteria group bacterium]
MRNARTGTLATSRGIFRRVGESLSHLETVFYVPDLDSVSYLEIGRMAAHPVFEVLAEIPALRMVSRSIKAEALSAVIRSQAQRALREKVPAVAILSETVRAYFERNRIVVTTPLPAKPLESEELHRLRERYPAYWIHGNPGVFRFTL